MMNKLKICAVSVAAAMLLASCQSKEPSTETVAPAKKPQAKPAAPVKAQAKPGEATQAKPEEPVKRRNPFSNYMLNLKAQGSQRKDAARIKGPLECCELNVFKLVAVVNAKDNSFALVLTPDGKRYFVHIGDMMGMKEGKVIRLESRSLTVRENIYDEFGKLVNHNDTVIKLPDENELRPRTAP